MNKVERRKMRKMSMEIRSSNKSHHDHNYNGNSKHQLSECGDMLKIVHMIECVQFGALFIVHSTLLASGD